MSNKPLPVMVTAIGGGGHGEQILKALRLAGADRYWIVGGDASANCPQFDLVHQPVVLPRASHPEYMDALLAVCRRFEVRALFHGCEPELMMFSRHREKIAAAGIFLPINPPDVIDTCMDKFKTVSFLSDHGFQPPWSAVFSAKEAISGVPGYPIVVKPLRGGGGSRDCFIAQNDRQLEILAEYLDVVNEPFLLQEYVGTPQDEYTVGVLHDMDGNFINSIAVRRLVAGALNMRLSIRNKTNRKDLGDYLVVSSGVSHGRIDDYPEVRTQCEQIAAAIGARGAVNIQCRFVDGKVKVFEINPRFSGTTSLRAMVGYNEPDVLVRRHVHNESIETRFGYRSGLILRSLRETFVDEHKRVLSWTDLPLASQLAH